MAQQQKQSRFRSIVMGISKGMVVISCITIAAMMFISTADVAGRYFFKHPISGSWELVSYAFIICGALAIGYTQLIKGHIVINIISDRLKPRPQAILYIISNIFCIVGSALVVWQGWLRMIDYVHATRGGVTATLSMPIWPFMLIFVLGFFWLLIVFLIDIYDNFVKVIKG
jgi:TRAP-type C4-dicarboxylate transport system permease small subunit